MYSCELSPELLELSGDSGGRKVAKRHECFYIDVEDEKELFDIDSEKDIYIYSQDWCYQSVIRQLTFFIRLHSYV